MLLDGMYDAGVTGKTWRLLSSWYVGSSFQVRVNGMVTEKFQRHEPRIMSPALFLLVMDPLLKQLQASAVGLSVSGYYAGGFPHANDITGA